MPLLNFAQGDTRSDEKRSDDMVNNSFLKLVGRRVKAKYLDEGTTCIVKGVLEEVDDSFIVVNDVVIGLGRNFISCIPQRGNSQLPTTKVVGLKSGD